MDKKLIVANMKMNMTYEQIKDYLNEVNELEYSHLVICPSNIYIPYFINHKYLVGIQNVASQNMGSLTGEVSAYQVSSLGVKYAIIGHSERRIKLGEIDSDINKKIKLCLDNNIKPILCVGETLKEYNNNSTKLYIEKQIIDALNGINDLNDVIIAYEPVWAIGSGNIPSTNEIANIIRFIKDVIKEHFGYNNIKVLYGGSINPENINLLNSINGLSGFLIGGASLSPSKLKKIIEVAVK